MKDGTVENIYQKKRIRRKNTDLTEIGPVKRYFASPKLYKIFILYNYLHFFQALLFFCIFLRITRYFSNFRKRSPL